MTDPRTLHREAMDVAEQALLLRRNGSEAKALELFRLAFEKEWEAARFFEQDIKAEPTRSVLYRSAAALALDHGAYAEAERLLATALTGYPPESVANEIRDLLESVHFQRHWDLRGIQLRPGEFQFSIDGWGTGYGIAPADQFVGRVNDVETMIYRTAERKLNQPYRDAGPPRKKAIGDFRLFLSVPRAASFAVTLRLGASKEQLELENMPGADFPEQVMREVLDCIDLVNQDELDALSSRIGDESYFRNFVGLAQKIAPDGEVVRAVGFTTTTEAGERRVPLTRPKTKIRPPMPTRPQEPIGPPVEVEIQGTLLEADATSEKEGRIQLRRADGDIEVVRVPRGMMRDIVKPLFEEEVIVQGMRAQGGIDLVSIRRADE